MYNFVISEKIFQNNITKSIHFSVICKLKIHKIQKIEI